MICYNYICVNLVVWFDKKFIIWDLNKRKPLKISTITQFFVLFWMIKWYFNTFNCYFNVERTFWKRRNKNFKFSFLFFVWIIWNHPNLIIQQLLLDDSVLREWRIGWNWGISKHTTSNFEKVIFENQFSLFANVVFWCVVEDCHDLNNF